MNISADALMCSYVWSNRISGINASKFQGQYELIGRIINDIVTLIFLGTVWSLLSSLLICNKCCKIKAPFIIYFMNILVKKNHKDVSTFYDNIISGLATLLLYITYIYFRSRLKKTSKNDHSNGIMPRGKFQLTYLFCSIPQTLISTFICPSCIQGAQYVLLIRSKRPIKIKNLLIVRYSQRYIFSKKEFWRKIEATVEPLRVELSSGKLIFTCSGINPSYLAHFISSSLHSFLAYLKLLLLHSDRPFHNFIASKSVDRRIFSSSETSSNGF